jgi:hypothetical protein
VAHLSRSDERARRVSEARTLRAAAYRHSRTAHAVRLQLARQLELEQQAAAAAQQGGSRAEAAGSAAAGHQPASQVNLIVKADVQVRLHDSLPSLGACH